MFGTIQLTVTRGELQGRKFVFSDRTLCTVGRASNCLLRLVDEAQHVVSRHHCLFDINPPHVRVRDLGSRNGTYLNDKNIGQRPAGQSPEEASHQELPAYELADGDEVQVGDTCFLVSITVPTTCSGCGRTVPQEEMGEARETAEGLLCGACCRKADPAQRPESQGPNRKQAVLVGKGKEVWYEAW